MATKNLVPNADGEGSIGTASLKWQDVNVGTVNELTLTKETTGFTVAGGTTSKTLTVSSDFNTSDAATQSDIIALAIALGG